MVRKAVTTRMAASPVARSATAGRHPAVGCGVWKHWAIGPIFAAAMRTFLFPGFINRDRIDAFGLFTGQVGYAWNNALFYVKGGGAVVDQRHDILLNGVEVARRDEAFPTPVGVPPLVPVSNTASLRVGRSASSTTTYSSSAAIETSSRPPACSLPPTALAVMSTWSWPASTIASAGAPPVAGVAVGWIRRRWPGRSPRGPPRY